jgi:sensor domain CHASE-containing protein
MIIFTASFYFIATKIILKSYSILENDIVSINIKRVNFAIDNIKKNQAVNLKGWATWDDTYNFSTNLNKEFIVNNLQVNSFMNFDFNFVVFIDNDGNVIFHKIVDLKTGEELNKNNLTTFIKDNYKILKPNTPDEIVNGMMDSEYGIIYLSSGPILKGDGTGPINGTLVLGHLLSDDVIKKIGDPILYEVNVFNYNDDLSPDVIIAKNNLSIDNNHFVQTLSSDTVAGYSMIYDLYNKPLAISRVILPRNYYNTGSDTFGMFTIMIAGLLLLFGLGVVFLFEKLIIRRFTILSKEFSNVSISKDLTKKITIDKDDEIGKLAKIANDMFVELHASEEKEKESNKLEKIAMENLEKHIKETETLNKLMINRELKIIELNKKVEELEKNKNN